MVDSLLFVVYSTGNAWAGAHADNVTGVYDAI